MTNQEIANRIPYLKELAIEYESDYKLGLITEEKYHALNQELVDEIDVLEETVRDNNFDEMMGHPMEMIAGWFRK